MDSSAMLECAHMKTVHPKIRTGDLAIDLEQRLVTVDCNPVCLTSKEYEILELLSLRKGTILTKEMFLNHLYVGRTTQPALKIIDGFIFHLRNKLAHANER